MINFLILFVIQYTMSALLFWITGMLLAKHGDGIFFGDLTSPYFLMSLIPICGIIASIIYLGLFLGYIIDIELWDLKEIMLSLHKNETNNLDE